jgi:acyl-[acyl-carrier-protein]-phospholipid O-acyltransferase/long-chain-fatty-acid--[acyl-carrier-protein] ligase
MRSDLPALWKPKANYFLRTDVLPVLGTGKIDLRGIRTLASSLILP